MVKITFNVHPERKELLIGGGVHVVHQGITKTGIVSHIEDPLMRDLCVTTKQAVYVTFINEHSGGAWFNIHEVHPAVIVVKFNCKYCKRHIETKQPTVELAGKELCWVFTISCKYCGKPQTISVYPNGEIEIEEESPCQQ